MEKTGENEYRLGELTFEITRKCPLGCLICSSDGGVPYPTEFHTERIKAIIDESVRLGTRRIVLSGGEPLAHIGVIEICNFIKDRGLEVDVYTCGNQRDPNGQIVPIDDETLLRLKRAAIGRLIFSIHGDRPEIHDQITNRKGSYANLLRSISLSKEIGLNAELHFVPTRLNYRTLSNIMKLKVEIGINRLSVLRFVPQGRGWQNRAILELDKNAIIELRAIMHRIRSDCSSFEFRVGAPFNCFNLDGPTPCTAGIDKATIRADGLVYPCVSMKNLPYENNGNDLGNLSLPEVWARSEIFAYVRERLSTAFVNGTCSGCEHLSDCGGGCLSQKLISGLAEATDPYCPVKLQDHIECSAFRRSSHAIPVR
ncbi:MAG: radical SAM protein [Methanomassiliicoccales archaeon]|jgi:radical SAM protein with 4Fe4S-binding SPASM domain